MLNINLITLFFGELIGTFLLILFGNGVVQTANIKKFGSSKLTSLTTICLGWAIGVLAGGIVGGAISSVVGVTINPAVATYLLFSEFDLGRVWFGTVFVLWILRVLGAFMGAMIAQVTLDLLHWKYLNGLPNNQVLATHSTVPAEQKDYVRNFFWEFLLTAVLIVSIMGVGKTRFSPGENSLFISLIVFALVACFGATGSAINPARDLGPRIIYQIMPFKTADQKTSMWSYSWIPVCAPLLAGLVLGCLSLLFFKGDPNVLEKTSFEGVFMYKKSYF